MNLVWHSKRNTKLRTLHKKVWTRKPFKGNGSQRWSTTRLTTLLWVMKRNNSASRKRRAKQQSDHKRTSVILRLLASIKFRFTMYNTCFKLNWLDWFKYTTGYVYEFSRIHICIYAPLNLLQINQPVQILFFPYWN